MTGEWEARLKRIQRGEGDFAGFMADITSFVTNAVALALAVTRPALSPGPLAIK
ncbi:MAG TPA: hypothetical protein DEP36_02655, partial [Gammaproteobacteria bacterium]|nr:hypothetical protein [Gammaproteobacteria bacterium]